MSRSGYSEDCTSWDLIRWRGAVCSAIKGKRGQSLLKDMAIALDAMPEKRLIAENLITQNGEVCALGSVAKAKSIKTDGIDPSDRTSVAELFNVSGALVAEIAFENDMLVEYGNDETPEDRWKRMRKWVQDNLVNS